MATLHLIEGPVGAGKSTFANRLAGELRAPWIDLDEWMVTLFRPDRPPTDVVDWYLERKQRCIEQIWRVTEQITGSGQAAILELGLVSRADRTAFYRRIDEIDGKLTVHVLETPEATRRSRVRERNRSREGTFKMEVTDAIFDLANRAWEAPDETECREREIRFVRG